MQRRSSTDHEWVAIRDIVPRVGLVVCLCVLGACSDTRTDAEWDVGVKSDAGDAVVSDASEVMRCEAIEARSPRNDFVERDDGVWVRVFPAFNAGCFRYHPELKLQRGPPSAQPEISLEGWVCNRCETERVLRLLQREIVDRVEPPTDISELTEMPVGRLGLSDSEGGRYVTGCRSEIWGGLGTRRLRFSLAPGRAVPFRWSTSLDTLTGWRTQDQAPLNYRDDFQLFVWWMRGLEPGGAYGHDPFRPCGILDSYRDVQFGGQELEEFFARQDLGAAHLPEWSRAYFRDVYGE